MADSAWRSSPSDNNRTPDFQSNIMQSRTTVGVLSQNETQTYKRNSFHYQLPNDNSVIQQQDYILKHDYEVQNLQVIGLSRQNNSGRRHIVIGGKSDPQVLEVNGIRASEGGYDEEVGIKAIIKYKNPKDKKGSQVEDLQWGPSKSNLLNLILSVDKSFFD